jgi:predicted metal-binding membrane protein
VGPATASDTVSLTGLTPAFAAVRARFGLVMALFALAGLGWLWSAYQMRGMDDGAWTSLGSLAWFLGVWVVMMAAMMLPSVAPTVALYARATKGSSPAAPSLFVGGYLLTWAIAGLVAYVVGAVASSFGDALGWDHLGRPIAAATLVAAAGYELTPLKNTCLAKCRSPLGALLGSWRGGRTGAVRMGARNGAWCVGCCWALMASLFALGVMSVSWMALVAGIIAMEKTLPWRRGVTYGTAALLLGLGVVLLVAPHVLPGFTVPTGEATMMG